MIARKVVVLDSKRDDGARSKETGDGLPVKVELVVHDSKRDGGA